MRMKEIKWIRTAAVWVQRFLEVRLPMGIFCGPFAMKGDKNNVHHHEHSPSRRSPEARL
jgi:hypothetical protein